MAMLRAVLKRQRYDDDVASGTFRYARDQRGKAWAHRRAAGAAGYSVSLSRVRTGHADFLHLMIWIEGENLYEAPAWDMRGTHPHRID
jgi:hypothetical protein